MKKSTKTLLILLVVLILLAGGLFAVKALTKDKPAEENGAAEEEEYTVLFSSPAEEITEISYSYAGESFTLIRQQGSWILKYDPEFPLNTAVIDAMATELAEVKLYKQIDTAEDLGFESDGIDITVKAGEKCHFVLGMKNNQIQKAYLLTDESVIYTTALSLRSAFSKTSRELLLADTLPEIPSSKITRLDVENGENSYAILQNETQTTYYAYLYTMETAQGITPLSTEKAQMLLQNAAAPILSCTDPAPDTAEISAAGFDAPITMTYHYTTADENGEDVENSYRVYFGKEYTETANGADTAYRYVMLEDSSMLFRLTKSMADMFLAPVLPDLAPAEICNIDFSNIKRFDFTLNGESHTSERKKEGDETICLFDGKEVNYGYVESFLLDVTNMLSEGGYPEETLPEGTPVFKAFFALDSERFTGDFTLEIYEYNANFCAASFSGRQDLMLVSVRDVDALTESLDELKRNAAR